MGRVEKVIRKEDRRGYSGKVKNSGEGRGESVTEKEKRIKKEKGHRAMTYLSLDSRASQTQKAQLEVTSFK